MVTWESDPEFKVEAGATDFSTDGLTIEVHRPENAISYVNIIANDYDGKNYIANIDAFTVIKVSLRYAGDAWTQVFEGVTERVGPRLNTKEQTVVLRAYGYGRALRNTHCNSNYGIESKNDALDTPHEIWDDLIANQINKTFGGAVTGYAILDTKVAPAANPVINFLEGGYRNNFTLMNDVLTSYQGFRNGLAGMHWFVDENGALFINTIAAHENNATGWPTWWRTDLAGSTLVEGVDFLGTGFHKKTNDYANRVILYCNLRKPGSDYWTEDSGGQALWGSVACTLTDANGVGPPIEYVVGSHSVKIDKDNVGAPIGSAWYPAAANAAWDLTKVGSEHAVPTLNFYFMKNNTLAEVTSSVRLFSTDNSNDVDYILFSTWTDPDDEWIHRSLPVGPYWATTEASRRYRWTPFAGGVDWTDVNGVGFIVDGDEDALLYIDDLHFSGKIIREAYNQTEVTANGDVQKIIRYDVAVDDTLKETDDTGTAGQLAYGELLRRQYIPTVGVFTTGLAEDALPGQLIHIHSDAHTPFGAEDYRVMATFRIKELIHIFSAEGATTTWDVTSDIINTFGAGFNDALSTYYKLIHTDPDMKNMKTAGLDPYVPRLTINYP